MPPRFIKPVLSVSAPTAVLSVAYDPLDTPTQGGGYRTSASSWTTAFSSRRGSEWSPVGTRTFQGERLADLWSYIDGLAVEHRRLYVVSRCATDTLTLADLWGRVDRGDVSLRLVSDTYKDRDGRRRKRRPHPLVLSGTPDVVGWSVGEAELRAVSLSNHLPSPLLELARGIGLPDPPDGCWIGRPTGHTDADSAWTAPAILTIYQRMISWWLKCGRGRWSDTVGAAAWQWWRGTLSEKEVLEHDVPSAMSLERASIYGGRAQVFWFGSAGGEQLPADAESYLDPARPIHLPGRVHKLDIRSMYASILRDAWFPVRLSTRIRDADIPALRTCCDHLCVVATVRVRLESPRLPYTDPERGVVYPTGEWWTTLTTPELRECIRRKEVTAVGECWSYARGRPFRRFADSLLSERAGARAKGDGVIEGLCKSLVNSLGGRLARTFRGWTTDPVRHPRERWGEWVEIDADTGENGRYRGVAGMLQRFVSKDERAGGLACMFSHLTAYGRMEIGRLIDLAGPGGVLWCDTDGLIVTDDGLAALTAAGEIADGVPGKLRYVEEVGRFAGRTPKHYQTAKGWTLAGARGDFSPVDGHKVRCYLSANPVRSGQRPDGRGLPTQCVTYHLDAIPLSGTPGPDGWLVHPVIRDGMLHQPRPDGEEELREMEG